MSDYESVTMNDVYRTYPSDPVGVYWVNLCTKCGIPVGEQHKETHTAFHEEIQELKDKVWRAGLE